LLGNTYMVLEPGGSDEMLPPGGQIEYTQDAVNLVDLLGRFIFSGGGSGGGAANSGSGANGGGTPQAPAPAKPQTGESSAPTVLQ
jgi:phospholipid/cholesterol/gamma-HCH transport system substrate-binding protein